MVAAAAARFEWMANDPEIVSDVLFAVANVLSIARTTYLIVPPATTWYDLAGWWYDLRRWWYDVVRFTTWLVVRRTSLSVRPI